MYKPGWIPFLYLSVLSANFVNAEIRLTSAVKNGDLGTKGLCSSGTAGSLCYMGWDNAKKFCERQNLMLPTAREYAIYLHENCRAKGIVEKFVLYKSTRVETIDRIGEEDSFYFDSKGYSCMDWPNNNTVFWTSSPFRSFSGESELHYAVEGWSGKFSLVYIKYNEGGVRCIDFESAQNARLF